MSHVQIIFTESYLNYKKWIHLSHLGYRIEMEELLSISELFLFKRYKFNLKIQMTVTNYLLNSSNNKLFNLNFNSIALQRNHSTTIASKNQQIELESQRDSSHLWYFINKCKHKLLFFLLFFIIIFILFKHLM